MKSKLANQKAYLTIYLSLIFGVILSLLLALIEGAATGACRLQSEIVADLGIDSVFAEYNQEMLNKYGLFFIDDSYGAKRGNVGNVKNHLSNFLEYNMESHNANIISYDFLTLENPYLEIEEVAFASDDDGKVFKEAAIEYMKEKTTIEKVKTFMAAVDAINPEWIEKDSIKEIKDSKESFLKKIKKDSDYSESSDRDEDDESGFYLSDIIDAWDDIEGDGVIDKVISDKSVVSDKKINEREYISFDAKHSKINKGCGNPEFVSNPDGLIDGHYFNKYLFDKCGNYKNPNEKGRLSYETEYIIFGRESDAYNLREAIERIISIRTAANLLYLETIDANKKKEAYEMALVISTLLASPEAAQDLTHVILGVWAHAESVLDAKCLINGGKISPIKSSSEWNLSLSDVLSFKQYRTNNVKGSNRKDALTYEDYLKTMLASTLPKSKVMRSMDIVEMNIRETEGNSNFRIDQCINYMKVSFGFKDSGNHEFVFTKNMRYE